MAWWPNGRGRRTNHQAVVGSTSSRVAIKWLLFGWATVCGQVNHISIITNHSGQLSLSSVGDAWLGLTQVAFTSVGWHVTLCDPI